MTSQAKNYRNSISKTQCKVYLATKLGSLGAVNLGKYTSPIEYLRMEFIFHPSTVPILYTPTCKTKNERHCLSAKALYKVGYSTIVISRMIMTPKKSLIYG